MPGSGPVTHEDDLISFHLPHSTSEVLYDPCFIDEKYLKSVCPRSHSRWATGPGFEARLSGVPECTCR